MRARSYSSGVLCLLLTSVAGADCPELLKDNEFSDGLGEWVVHAEPTYATVSYDITADDYKALEIEVDADDVDPQWLDAYLGQAISLVAGQHYQLTFWARGDQVPITVAIARTDGTVLRKKSYVLSFNDYKGANYTFEYDATETGDALLAIGFGEEDASLTFDSLFLKQTSSPLCDNPGTAGSGGGGAGGVGGASSLGGANVGGAMAAGGSSSQLVTGAVIRVNQVGYIPSAEKLATVSHPSATPLNWQLVDGADNVLASGVTRSKANDPISGDPVHLVDFSSYTNAGTGLRLRVGDAQSQSIRIGGDVYGGLRRDALRFYYYQRASTGITQPYAEGTEWVRGSGHLDTNVACRSDAGCTGRRNVTKGWYDAGDYGKYVVNGGISAWTLMHLYERARSLGTSIPKLADGASNIPESANGIPDLLDEVRWEMEFLLAMQVPEGWTLAGMAYHKIHGKTWPPIPTEPAADTTTRFISAPSTAATLNLAATAAQCARVFAGVDDVFATRCRTAATTAFAAALAHPALYAVSTAATVAGGDDDGGGAYDDATVTDEFYWAAAELYATTGESQYLDRLVASPHHKTITTTGAPFSWQSTAALGLLTLATTTDNVSANVVSDVRHSLVDAAAVYQATAATAYGSAIKNYNWGSNADVLNAAMVMALAYDLTGELKYRGSAIGALDYVLGRNPLGQSYVTGYGALRFANVHHRFFAHGFDSTWPSAPPGFVAGGPNTNLDGLTPVGSLATCVGPKCWTDVAAAYGLTEVTINWNAPLAWMAAWASEQETSPKATFPGFVGGVAQNTGGSNSGGAANLGGANSSLLSQGGTGPLVSSQGGQATAQAGAGSSAPLTGSEGGAGVGSSGAAASAGHVGTGAVNTLANGGSPTSTPNTIAAAAAAGVGSIGGTNQDPECNCRVVGAPRSPASWLGLAALGLLLRRKRR